MGKEYEITVLNDFNSFSKPNSTGLGDRLQKNNGLMKYVLLEMMQSNILQKFCAPFA